MPNQTITFVNMPKGRQKNIVRWGPFAAGDTFDPAIPNETEALGAIVHFTGGAYGGSVALVGSIDGVNWFALKDLGGNAISAVAGGPAFEFSTGAAMIRPDPAAGVAGATVTLCMRG